MILDLPGIANLRSYGLRKHKRFGDKISLQKTVPRRDLISKIWTVFVP